MSLRIKISVAAFIFNFMRSLSNFLRLQSVSPDIKLQSSQITPPSPPKSYPKSSHISFNLKSDVFKEAKNHQIFGLLYQGNLLPRTF